MANEPDRGRTARTRITVETETLLVVRQSKAALAWCPECGAEVNAIALDSVRQMLAGTSRQERLGSGKVHSWQAANGPVQICVPSLLHYFDSAEVPKPGLKKERT